MKYLILFVILFLSNISHAQSYRELLKQYCNHPDYFCKVIGYKNKTLGTWHSWNDFWPNQIEQLIIKKINRLNMYIVPGMKIIIPRKLNGKTYMDFAPTPRTIRTAEKVFIWYSKLLAWGAYDSSGKLLNWGPALGGLKVCKEEQRSCKTPTGTFEALSRGSYTTRSIRYPEGCDGRECAWMPYFVKVTRDGVGIHGSKYFIGRHDSHGCIRLFIADARWLNKTFFDIKTDLQKGTKIVLLPY